MQVEASDRPDTAAFFGDWLENTGDFQRDVYGVVPSEMTEEEWIEYVRWNVLAAHTELSEFLQRMRWKPWSRLRGRPPREEVVMALTEIVDLLHFAANILCALGVTDKQLNERYALKQRTNAVRQERGY